MSVLLEDEEIRGLDRLPPDAQYEVVDGEAVEIPWMTACGAVVASEFAFALGRHTRGQRCVIVVEGLFAFRGFGRWMRPDVAYVPEHRLPADWPPLPGSDPQAIHAVPALVAELAPATARMEDFADRRAVYRRAGVRTVLIIRYIERTIHVFDATDCRLLTETDTLAGLTALPELTVPVADLFAPLNRP